MSDLNQIDGVIMPIDYDNYLEGVVNNVNSIVSKSVEDISSILEDTKVSISTEITNLKTYIKEQEVLNNIDLSPYATKVYVDEKIGEINSSLAAYATTKALSIAVSGMTKTIQLGNIKKTANTNGDVSFTTDELKNMIGLGSYLKTDSKISWSNISGAPQFVTSQLTANDISNMGFAKKGTSDIGISGVKVNNNTTTQGTVDLGYILKQVTWKKDGVVNTWSPSQSSGILDLGEISSGQNSQPSQVKPSTNQTSETPFEIVEYSTNPTTATIEPNKLYKWKTNVTAVNVSLVQPTNTNAVAVYTLRFKTSSSFSGFKIKTPTSKILVPYDITWNANTEYEVSILFDKYTYTFKQIPLREISSNNADTPILIA